MDWNYAAVGDLLAFDHTLDDDTLTGSPPYSAPGSDRPLSRT